ncbi:S-4TM family putative pore-forming effector [Olleya sp. ITB9]|uniref:S-4TM family putative pore-forming effector n=1 Tax=Olleya sp. ITB9 TaxID=1715648 RepID=UPI0006D1570C|nr:S-4TM family putative pore-forming effector [Olleya sp. ITB9]
MNRIIQKQNESKFIEYLKAQRVAYSQCKVYQLFDVISVLMAIILPIIGILNKDIVNYLGAFGVLWTIIYLVTENYRKKKTEQGAKIQEQFDTELFEMPWNDILCKNKVNSDTQIDLANNYEGNDLSNWYSLEVDSSLPKPIAIILCQRINFSWELKLRKRYVTFLIILLVTYYGLFIAFFISKNIGFYDILLLIAPSLSFLIYAVQNSLSLKNHINSKNETLGQIDEILDKYSINGEIPDESILRQIQDIIYSERTVPEKIPDWFYKLSKSSNEDRTDNIIKSIKAKF